MFPQGSHRVMAMGGAYAALSDDATGVTYNPAGLAFQPYWGDLGGNVNTVYNREVDLDGDGQKDGIPYTYHYYAATFRAGDFGFGVGSNSPYNLNISFNSDLGGFTETRTLQLTVETFNLPVAYRISKQWSFGVNLQGHTVTERYRFVSTNPSTSEVDVATKATAATIVSGIMFRPDETWSFGLFYSPRAEFNDINSELNNQTGGVNWFRNVVIPSKTTLGGAYRLDRWVFTLDLDHFEGLSNVQYVGSQLIPEFRRVEFDGKEKWVLHGGVEWNPVSTNMWDWYLRAGSYNEPPRALGVGSRQHTTFGTELRYWVLSLSAAVDGAENFANFAVGLGVSLKPYL